MDKDASPPRMSTIPEDASPPRRKIHLFGDEDHDTSPPRRPAMEEGRLPPRRASRSLLDNDDDDDASLPHRTGDESPSGRPSRSVIGDNNDASPPRRRLPVTVTSTFPLGQKTDDASPPRKTPAGDLFPPISTKEITASKSRKGVDNDDDASPPRRTPAKKLDRDDNSEAQSVKLTKTGAQQKIGLRLAHEVAQDTERMKQERETMMEQLKAGASGKGAATVYREDGKLQTRTFHTYAERAR